MKINIKKTLSFFDEKRLEDTGHASGVVGILGEDLNTAAFKHFMERKGGKVEILNIPVTTGQKKGKRLDRWIYIKIGREEILYQTEIKNWSSWAIGGKLLPINADNKAVVELAKYYWDGQIKRDFIEDEGPTGVTKVLIPMSVPKEYKKDSIRVEPLLIYWMPISNTEKIDPFFSVTISEINRKIKTEFKKLYIFSVSLYLRQLLKKRKVYDFDMPHVEERMKVLNDIIVN